MSEYNWEVITRCRRCINDLTAENVRAALIYGEKDVVEVLRDLSFDAPVKMRILREPYEVHRDVGREVVSLDMGVSATDKIIVASLVNTEARIRRLRELGVVNERIVLLT